MTQCYTITVISYILPVDLKLKSDIQHYGGQSVLEIKSGHIYLSDAVH